MVKRFYVHNFRCLENFELLLGERPSTLLIGKNGVGKSTVATALQVLQKVGRGVNRVDKLVKPHDLSRGRRDVPVRLELEVSLDGSTYAYELALELPEGFKELRIAEEKLSVDGRSLYSRDRAQVSLFNQREDQASFRVDWHLVALPLIQERSEKDPLAIFRTWLARMIILAPVPLLMHGESQGDTLWPDLSASNVGEWLTGLLAQQPSAYKTIDSYAREAMADFQDIQNPVIGRESRSLVVHFEAGGASLKIPFEHLSDGEKCFFLCGLTLAANKSYGPILCFWDEPDNFLTLTEVSQFVMALRRAFQQGGQLIITSHNPEAIRRFSHDNTLVLFRRSHLEPSLIRTLGELQFVGDVADAILRDDLQP